MDRIQTTVLPVATSIDRSMYNECVKKRVKAEANIKNNRRRVCWNYTRCHPQVLYQPTMVRAKYYVPEVPRRTIYEASELLDIASGNS